MNLWFLCFSLDFVALILGNLGVFLGIRIELKYLEFGFTVISMNICVPIALINLLIHNKWVVFDKFVRFSVFSLG